MDALGSVVLAGSWCAMPWAMRRGLSELGESALCGAVDYGVIALGSIAGLVCFGRDDVGGAVLCTSAAISSVTDMRNGVVLDSVLVVASVAIGIVAFAAGRLPATALGAAASLVAMGVVFVIGRGAMGLGDVKFAGLVGAVLGVERGLTALGVAFVLGGLVAAILLAAGRVRRGQALPFAPYLAFGAVAVACNVWPIAAGR